MSPDGNPPDSPTSKIPQPSNLDRKVGVNKSPNGNALGSLESKIPPLLNPDKKVGVNKSPNGNVPGESKIPRFSKGKTEGAPEEARSNQSFNVSTNSSANSLAEVPIEESRRPTLKKGGGQASSIESSQVSQIPRFAAKQRDGSPRSSDQSVINASPPSKLKPPTPIRRTESLQENDAPKESVVKQEATRVNPASAPKANTIGRKAGANMLAQQLPSRPGTWSKKMGALAVEALQQKDTPQIKESSLPNPSPSTLARQPSLRTSRREQEDKSSLKPSAKPYSPKAHNPAKAATSTLDDFSLIRPVNLVAWSLKIEVFQALHDSWAAVPKESQKKGGDNIKEEGDSIRLFDSHYPNTPEFFKSYHKKHNDLIIQEKKHTLGGMESGNQSTPVKAVADMITSEAEELRVSTATAIGFKDLHARAKTDPKAKAELDIKLEKKTINFKDLHIKKVWVAKNDLVTDDRRKIPAKVEHFAKEGVSELLEKLTRDLLSEQQKDREIDPSPEGRDKEFKQICIALRIKLAFMLHVTQALLKLPAYSVDGKELSSLHENAFVAFYKIAEQELRDRVNSSKVAEEDTEDFSKKLVGIFSPSYVSLQEIIKVINNTRNNPDLKNNLVELLDSEEFSELRSRPTSKESGEKYLGLLAKLKVELQRVLHEKGVLQDWDQEVTNAESEIDKDRQRQEDELMSSIKEDPRVESTQNERPSRPVNSVIFEENDERDTELLEFEKAEADIESAESKDLLGQEEQNDYDSNIEPSESSELAESIESIEEESEPDFSGYKELEEKMKDLEDEPFTPPQEKIRAEDQAQIEKREKTESVNIMGAGQVVKAVGEVKEKLLALSHFRLQAQREVNSNLQEIHKNHRQYWEETFEQEKQKIRDRRRDPILPKEQLDEAKRNAKEKCKHFQEDREVAIKKVSNSFDEKMTAFKKENGLNELIKDKGQLLKKDTTKEDLSGRAWLEKAVRGEEECFGGMSKRLNQSQRVFVDPSDDSKPPESFNIREPAYIRELANIGGAARLISEVVREGEVRDVDEVMKKAFEKLVAIAKPEQYKDVHSNNEKITQKTRGDQSLTPNQIVEELQKFDSELRKFAAAELKEREVEPSPVNVEVTEVSKGITKGYNRS